MYSGKPCCSGRRSFLCVLVMTDHYKLATIAATSATMTLPRRWSFVVYNMLCITHNDDTSFVAQFCLCLFIHSYDTYIIFNTQRFIACSVEPAAISREILISSDTARPSDRYKIYKRALFSIYIKVC